MQGKFLKLFLLMSLLFSWTLNAQQMERKIRLMGKVKADVPKRLSVKEINSGLKFIEENVFNPYEKHSDLYGGVLLSDFVTKYAQKDITEIRLIAVDDYSVVIPKVEWTSKRIILSSQTNHKTTSIKEKGPLRIIFPDYDSKLKTYQLNLPMWVWMITKIEFR